MLNMLDIIGLDFDIQSSFVGPEEDSCILSTLGKLSMDPGMLNIRDIVGLDFGIQSSYADPEESSCMLSTQGKLLRDPHKSSS